MKRHVFAVDEFRDAIAADFAHSARNITADVLVGEWRTAELYGAPRVVIGIGQFTIEDPAGMRFAGMEFELEKADQDQPAEVAKAILARVQTYTFWVHSVAAPDVDPTLAVVETRRATAKLLDQTLAAIRRTSGGLVHGWTPGKPFSEDRAEFVYGSVIQFGVLLAVPVLGDPSEVGETEQTELQTQADIDGALTPEQTSVEG